MSEARRSVPQNAESPEEPRLEAVGDKNMELLQDILRDLSPITHRSNTAAELSNILTQPHFQVRIRREHTHTHARALLKLHNTHSFFFFFDVFVCFVVSPGDPRLGGVQDVRDSSAEPTGVRGAEPAAGPR